MRLAIRKHMGDFAAIIVLLLIALLVGGYILSQQRFYLPAWVPGIGTDFFTVNAEFSSAKAVTPGQGQTVTIAGIDVGDITKVELDDGRARVEMKIRQRYAERIRKDATLLLRPKTGLEDMVVEMSPGSAGAERVPEGWTVPVRNTLPDVKLDQILLSLDRDTRDFVRLLLDGGADGLRGEGDQLAATFKRFEPGARSLRQISDALEERRGNIRRSIHNLRLLVEAVGEKDDQLTQLVDSSNAVFRSFAAQDRNLRTSLQRLPKTVADTRVALEKTGRMADVLGPTLSSLRPAARALGPTLRETRPFLRETTPIIQRQLRPFSREVLPTLRSLAPAAVDLARVMPDLDRTFRVLNHLFNELAYNPPGKAEEGFLFWAGWGNHIAGTSFTTQDAMGPLRRGNLLVSCSSAQVLDTIISADKRLGMITQVSGLPLGSQICPITAQSGTAPAQGQQQQTRPGG